MANKVQFGLKNVHYAVVTETVGLDGAITSSYGTVKKWNGAVNIDLSKNGSSEEFYADDRAYYHLETNAGYSGSIECALVPDDILKDVFGMVADSTNGGIAEYSDVEQKYIALLFEISGDASAKRYCFYRVALSRPSVSSSTTTEGKEVKTQTCDLSATQRPDDYLIKYAVTSDDDAYNDFFDAVVVASR